MLSRLSARGPDHRSVFHDRSVTLGHTRLSVIDLETGNQPVFNEDRTVACVLNGEIYNFQDLRRRLIAAGHAFRTGSDTEVIVHLYEEEGEAAFGKLEGMFAVAVYDLRQECLLVARDRLGEKPVVYCDTPEYFLCGSEIKALLAWPDMVRTVSPESLALYLNALYVPAPNTIFKGIHKLQPAHYLKVTNRGTEQIRYWQPDTCIDYSLDAFECAEEIARRLSRSVRSKLVADVPLGAFLSGGIDSSAVVAFMATHASRAIKTFSVGFDHEINELPFARLVAQRYGTDHTEIEVRTDIRDVLPKVVAYFDEPFGDSSSVPTYLIAREARKHVTVILTGDGGDELFAGYGSYLTQRYYANNRLASRLLRLADRVALRLAGRTVTDPLYRYQPRRAALEHWLSIKPYFDDQSLAGMSLRVPGGIGSFYAQHRWLSGSADDPLSVAFLHDINYYLPDDLLKKVDMAAMAHSLECRAPFLDHHLVEFALKIPPALKVRGQQTKYLLRRALEPYLPAEIVHRRKQGFGAPIASWLQDDLKEMVHDLLHAGCRTAGLLDWSAIARIREEVYTGYRDWRRPQQLWSLLALELWLSAYSENAASSPRSAGRIAAGVARA